FAEVELPEDQAATAGSAGAFGIHPALFDASLHAGLLGSEPSDGSTRLPFSWAGGRLGHGTGSRVRGRLDPNGESALRGDIHSEQGELGASVARLTSRAVEQSQLQGARRDLGNALFRVSWDEVPAPNSPAPAVVAFLGDAGTGAGAERFADL